jgi:transposase-like protein
LGITPISYAPHRLPPDVIRHAVRLYLRFTLSYSDVEELLTERGPEVSYEMVLRWVLMRAAIRSQPARHERHAAAVPPSTIALPPHLFA